MIGVLITVLGLRLLFVHKNSPTPNMEADWNTDLNFNHQQLSQEAITSKVRDFYWRTTKDRDEKWVDDVW